jgi:hypothetical protein
MANASSEWLVRTRIRTAGCSRRISFNSSRPSTSGNSSPVTTTSHATASRSANASAPDAASPTTMRSPAWAATWRTPRRTIWVIVDDNNPNHRAAPTTSENRVDLGFEREQCNESTAVWAHGRVRLKCNKPGYVYRRAPTMTRRRRSRSSSSSGFIAAYFGGSSRRLDASKTASSSMYSSNSLSRLGK